VMGRRGLPCPVVFTLTLLLMLMPMIPAEALFNCTTGCSTSSTSQELREVMRRDQLMRELLAKLGLHSVPRVNVSSPMAHSPRLAEFIEMPLGDQPSLSTSSVSTARTFVIGQSAGEEEEGIVQFNFSQSTRSRSLANVYLHVFLRPANASVLVVAYEQLRNGRGATLGEHRFHRRAGEDGFVRLQLDPSDLQRWWENEAAGKNELVGLHVEAMDDEEKSNLAVNVGTDSNTVCSPRFDTGPHRPHWLLSLCSRQCT